MLIHKKPCAMLPISELLCYSHPIVYFLMVHVFNCRLLQTSVINFLKVCHEWSEEYVTFAVLKIKCYAITSVSVEHCLQSICNFFPLPISQQARFVPSPPPNCLSYQSEGRLGDQDWQAHFKVPCCGVDPSQLEVCCSFLCVCHLNMLTCFGCPVEVPRFYCLSASCQEMNMFIWFPTLFASEDLVRSRIL